MTETVIVAGARTPFAKLGGALSTLSAMQLGGHALKAALSRADVNGEDLDEVIMGHVLQGGQGQLTSRQAAREAGIPWHVGTETINKVCASGMRSVTLADQIIRSGDAETIAAGGMESMSQAPHFLPNLRSGKKMGDAKLIDMMVHDGLTCAFENVHMGVYGNRNSEEFNISREAQDEWAKRSHDRALAATESGRFLEEIEPVTVPQRRGDDVVVSRDEAIRENVAVDKLGSLPSAFGKEGVITAGNAPGVNDGASALILMEKEAAVRQNKEPLATIVGHAAIAVETERFPQTPGLIIEKLCQKTGYRVEDIDLFEMNEAFATVALIGQQISGIDPEKLNVNGGAVALGHPIGASGNRVLLTLAHELQKRGGGLGIAAICSGGGQGDAVLLKV